MNATTASVVLSLSLSTSALLAGSSPVYVSSLVELPGGQSTYFAPRGAGALVGSGTINAVSGTTVTDNEADWSDDLFNGDYYIELTSGDHAGLTSSIVDTDGTNGVLTLVDDLGARSPAVAAGTGYAIRKHLSLDDLFGPANEAGLTAGANAADADEVLLWDAASQTTQGFFYKNTGAWRDSADTADSGFQAIRAHEGLIVARSAGGALTVHQQTQARTGPAIVPLAEGFNIVGTQRGAAGLSLGAAALESAVAGGLNPSSADSVYRVDPATGAFELYYYFDTTGTADDGWVDARYDSAVGTTVPAGAVFIVQRKSAGASEWTVPAE